MAPSQRCIGSAVQAALNQVGSPDSIVCRDSWKKKRRFLMRLFFQAVFFAPGKAGFCPCVAGCASGSMENMLKIMYGITAGLSLIPVEAIEQVNVVDHRSITDCWIGKEESDAIDVANDVGLSG